MKNNAIALLVLICTASATAKKPPRPRSAACKAYFVVAEQDAEVTVGLRMVGLNSPQSKWYKKHGGKYPDLCLASADPSGKRVALDSGSESYLDSTVGNSPLYLIAWGEHRRFVPDTTGGHYAWSANGVLSRWDNSKNDFVPVVPLHNTNRTILTSSSTSLLKDGLKEIERRIR